jgi:glycosyltransferase involved in cell wall biosynthesis
LPPDVQQHIRLTVIGSGPDAPKLVQLLESSGWSELVRFKGFVQYEDIPELLGQAHCCICPLPDRKEWQMSSPLKIFEYMAAAKPIVATPITAHSNVLGESPYVVWTEGFDEKAIANGMKTAYENRRALAEAAAVAPDIARANFDWEIIGRGFADYLKTRYE